MLRVDTSSSGGGRQRTARGGDRQAMLFFLVVAHASASAAIRVIDTTGTRVPKAERRFRMSGRDAHSMQSVTEHLQCSLQVETFRCGIQRGSPASQDGVRARHGVRSSSLSMRIND